MDPKFEPLFQKLQQWRETEADLSEDLTQKENEEVAAAIGWLREKWGEERPCPYCGSTSHAVGPPGSLVHESGKAVSPSIPVVCRNCGNTTFIDLRVLDGGENS